MALGRRGPGLVGMAARTAVVAGTATAVSGRVARRQQRKYAEEDQQYVQQVYEPMADPQAGGAPGEPDYTAELEQLAQLKAQGIITEDEFQAKKKQILGI
jgi:Short C-terminal domain